MNKNELVAAVADKADLTKAQASDAVEAALEIITSALKSGDEVRLLGFGNFVVVDRKATTARNPQTGATVDVPASKAPKFKPGKALKDAVPGLHLMLAGDPGDKADAFTQAGMDGFISIKSNNYETNAALLKKLGVL